MRGTPWLGSRRGVVITSRSDRVPLLSRRHTLAEKQNGTSDRPTDPSPFSPSSFPLLHTLRAPGLFLSFSPLTSHFLVGSPAISISMKYSQETVDTSPSNARNVAARIIRVIDIRKAKMREKGNAEERNGGMRKNYAGRVEYPPFPIVSRHSRFDSGD